MPGSLTGSFLWSGWRRKRSRHSWCMRNPQSYVVGTRPIDSASTENWHAVDDHSWGVIISHSPNWSWKPKGCHNTIQTDNTNGICPTANTAKVFNEALPENGIFLHLLSLWVIINHYDPTPKQIFISLKISSLDAPEIVVLSTFIAVRCEISSKWHFCGFIVNEAVVNPYEWKFNSINTFIKRGH